LSDASRSAAACRRQRVAAWSALALAVLLAHALLLRALRAPPATLALVATSKPAASTGVLARRLPADLSRAPAPAVRAAMAPTAPAKAARPVAARPEPSRPRTVLAERPV
jgi:hypothetical protein